MAIMSARFRQRLVEFGLTAVLILFCWLLQLTVLSHLAIDDVLASLPMTLTIVWGSVFGSRFRDFRPDELKTHTLGQLMARQAVSGSLSGAIVGGFFGALYGSILPVYPVCFPLVGWIAGYFSLKNFNQAMILCLPIVFLLSVTGEAVLSGQLALIGRPEVLPHLASVAFVEAVLNALMAPFVFFPMRGWYEFAQTLEATKN